MITDNQRDEMAFWMAALMSATRINHGVIRLPVSRLHAGIRHLIDSGKTDDMLVGQVQDPALAWFGQALADAQDFGLQIEGNEGEFLYMTIEQARKVLKWIDVRNGTAYANRVARQADDLAAFLNQAS